MRENPVRRKLRDGGVAIGTMVTKFNSTGSGRLAAEAGADFVLYDMEHTGWSVETMRGLVAATVGTVPLVRVAATEYHFMGRVLDVGAMGLMIPMGSAGPASARARPSPSSVQLWKRRGCSPAASAVWPAVSTSGCTRKRSAAASTSCATMKRRRNDRLWDRGGTRAGGVLA